MSNFVDHQLIHTIFHFPSMVCETQIRLCVEGMLLTVYAVMPMSVWKIFLRGISQGFLSLLDK